MKKYSFILLTFAFCLFACQKESTTCPVCECQGLSVQEGIKNEQKDQEIRKTGEPILKKIDFLSLFPLPEYFDALSIFRVSETYAKFYLDASAKQNYQQSILSAGFELKSEVKSEDNSEALELFYEKDCGEVPCVLWFTEASGTESTLIHLATTRDPLQRYTLMPHSSVPYPMNNGLAIQYDAFFLSDEYNYSYNSNGKNITSLYKRQLETAGFENDMPFGAPPRYCKHFAEQQGGAQDQSFQYCVSLYLDEETLRVSVGRIQG